MKKQYIIPETAVEKSELTSLLLLSYYEEGDGEDIATHDRQYHTDEDYPAPAW